MRLVFQSISLIAFHLLLQTRFRKSPCKFFSKQLAIFESTASKSPVAILEMEDDIAKSSIVFACSISLFNAQLEPFLSTVLRNIHFPHSAGPVFASTFTMLRSFVIDFVMRCSPCLWCPSRIGLGAWLPGA